MQSFTFKVWLRLRTAREGRSVSAARCTLLAVVLLAPCATWAQAPSAFVKESVAEARSECGRQAWAHVERVWPGNTVGPNQKRATAGSLFGHCYGAAFQAAEFLEDMLHVGRISRADVLACIDRIEHRGEFPIPFGAGASRLLVCLGPVLRASSG